MAITLQNLLDAVREETNQLVNTFNTDAYLTGKINEAHIELAREVPRLFKKSTTITLVAGTNEYSLPTDSLVPPIFFYVGTSLDYGNRVVATELNELYDNGQFVSTNTGYPLYYYDSPDNLSKIRVYPTPESSATLTVYYAKKPVTLVLVTDPSDLPDSLDFKRAIVDCTVWLMMGREDDPQKKNFYKFLWEEDVMKIRDYFNQSKDKYTSVRFRYQQALTNYRRIY